MENNITKMLCRSCAGRAAAGFLALFPLAAMHSCMTYSYIVTDVHPDLSADRCVYSSADSSSAGDTSGASRFFFVTDTLWNISPVKDPFTVDFPTGQLSAGVAASRHYPSPADGMLSSSEEGRRMFTPVSGDQAGNPLLAPQEHLSKKFRWFYTEYGYDARYKALSGFPIPLDSALALPEKELFLRGGSFPNNWNGMETYAYLDGLNMSLTGWINANILETCFSVMQQFMTEGQKRTLEAGRKDIFWKLTGEDLTDAGPREICSKADSILGENKFLSSLYEQNASAADSLYGEKSRVIDYFSLAFIHKVRLPGRVVRTDAPISGKDSAEWTIDCWRLLYGDMTLSAASRKANVWAIAVTFILLTVVITSVAVGIRRRNR